MRDLELRLPPKRRLSTEWHQALQLLAGNPRGTTEHMLRIYREMIIGKPNWRWFLQQIPEAGPGRPIPPPNQGMADTLDEAKAAFAKRYEEVKRGNDGPRRPREFRAMIVPPLTREQCEALELLASGRYGINEEMVFGERGRSFQSLLLCRRRNARR